MPARRSGPAYSLGSTGFARRRGNVSSAPVDSTLYSLAQSAAYATDFHGIIVGHNIQAGSSAGFFAAPGYDLASGWGTPNVMNLAEDLAAH